MSSADPRAPGASAEQGPAAGDVQAPELSVRVVSMLLHHFRQTCGQERLEALWRRERIALPITHFFQHANYVSLRFTEHLIQLLATESGDPDFIRKAAMKVATPEAMGFMFHMLKALSTPRRSYVGLIQVSHTYNRVGVFNIDELGEHQMVLSYRSRVRENNRNFCIGRMAQFASIPTIWGLPPADVHEEGCQVEGAECCRYVLRWQNPLRSWGTYLGALVGCAAGAVAGGLDVSPLTFALPTLLGTGALAGAVFDRRRELRRLEESLSTQAEGLARSLDDLRRRSDELHQANVDLERRVQERTQELSHANHQLQAALTKQKEMDRLKTEFFDNVSHELRTPLTLILLTLDALLQQPLGVLPASARMHLETMERSASRLLRLINNLLDLAKMEAGKMRLRYSPLELYGFLGNLLLPFRVLAEKKKVALVVEGSPTTPVEVDSEQIDIVFQNLLSNALKFTSEGKVVVRVHEDASHVEVEVADTGQGIAPQDQRVIFDRFAQADASGTRRFGGTGIGLALVKETIVLHGGSIEVQSELGKGATFRVRLPKGTAHIREELRERRRAELPVRRDRRAGAGLPRVLIPLSGARSSTELPAVLPTLPDNAPRILLVEDDAEIRGFLARVLKQYYHVVEAAHGEEGRRRATEEKPDVVVSDVMMPVMSGLQMLEALRAQEATADVPVILLTARQEVEAKVEGLSCGANDYIGKPFNPRELLARIEAQLRLRNAANRAAENERLAATGLLTSGFAHEVRNPLNGLMNAILPLRESLGEQPDPDTAGAMLDVIEECGGRIRHLAESLLSFVRSGGERPLAVDVSRSLEATLGVLGWRIPKGVHVERDYGCADAVLADPGALNQVWVNLLDNALRAVGPTGRVRVGTERQGEEVVVRVSDDGPGIRPEDMRRLFEPFFSTRPAGEGTGLGLSLCRRIVLHHGGHITLQSQPGQGTCAEVRLPLAIARARSLPSLPLVAEPPPRPSTRVAAVTLPPPRASSTALPAVGTPAARPSTVLPAVSASLSRPPR